MIACACVGVHGHTLLYQTTTKYDKAPWYNAL